MNAHAAILQALYARERTGKGCHIAVSLFDGIADWMTVPLIHREYTGREPQRLGLAHPTIAPYGAYAVGDGAQFIISIQTETEWASLCLGVLERPDMIDDARFSTNSRRAANRGELDAEMASALSRFDAAGMAAALRRANIAFGRYNTVGEFAHHSQLRRVEIGAPSGPVSVPAPPPIFDDEPVALGPVPAIGEHSDAIRREFAED
jgi:crotonobetainyl-CoA:carnitine CoA-transferase CaiB-like acyl-CoA transferase